MAKESHSLRNYDANVIINEKEILNYVLRNKLVENKNKPILVKK